MNSRLAARMKGEASVSEHFASMAQGGYQIPLKKMIGKLRDLTEMENAI